MATKTNISQVLDIIHVNNFNKLIDTYFTLVKISSQYREERTKRNFFVIYTESDSYCNLYKVIKKEAPYFRSRTTVATCIKELKYMGIIQYSRGMGGWFIKGMADMFDTGYMELPRFFFTKDFYNLNISEKKALVYAIYIINTKGYKNLRKIMVNLKEDESEWRKIFKSKNVYYLRRRILNIIRKFFRDLSEEFRRRELEKYKGYESSYVRRKKRELGFRFVFRPNRFIEETIGKKPPELMLEELRDTNPGLHGYIRRTKEQLEDWIRKKFTDKIEAALYSNCKALTYPAQQYITEMVIRKLYDIDEIKSPDKYIGAIVLAYIQEN